MTGGAKTFDEIMARFREIQFHETFDTIVAIANGGVIPAAILNQRLNVDFQIIKINLRDANQQPRYHAPRLLSPIDFEVKGKTILLVEDRVKTGATIGFAKELLKEAKTVKTFAVNGAADYALFNDNCFRFPWIL